MGIKVLTDMCLHSCIRHGKVDGRVSVRKYVGVREQRKTDDDSRVDATDPETSQSFVSLTLFVQSSPWGYDHILASSNTLTEPWAPRQNLVLHPGHGHGQLAST